MWFSAVFRPRRGRVSSSFAFHNGLLIREKNRDHIDQEEIDGYGVAAIRKTLTAQLAPGEHIPKTKLMRNLKSQI